MGLDKKAQEELAALPPPRPGPGVTHDQAINLHVAAYLMDADTGTRREDVDAFVRKQVPRSALRPGIS